MKINIEKTIELLQETGKVLVTELEYDEVQELQEQLEKKGYDTEFNDEYLWNLGLNLNSDFIREIKEEIECEYEKNLVKINIDNEDLRKHGINRFYSDENDNDILVTDKYLEENNLDWHDNDIYNKLVKSMI